jgi:hypothetical protein
MSAAMRLFQTFRTPLARTPTTEEDESTINIDLKPFFSGVYYAFVIQEGKKVLSKPVVIVK